MKGYIHATATLLGLVASALVANAQAPCATCGTCATGTCGVNRKDCFDRCWPQRYNDLSHRAVNRAITPQVQNGFVLDQTVWNHMFECGTDILNPMGQAHLQYLSRRRPEPDRLIYLASAMDLQYDPACPDRYCGARQELDSLRVAAIQRFLTGLNCGRCPDFQVLVHDPADVSIAAIPAGISVIQMYGRFRGGIGSGGAAGAAGAAGGAGGFSGSGTATPR